MLWIYMYNKQHSHAQVKLIKRELAVQDWTVHSIHVYNSRCAFEVTIFTLREYHKYVT